MRVFAFLAGFVLLLGLARCKQSGAANEGGPEPVVLPDTLTLAYRDTLFLPGDTDWLTFDSLAHDSRCATGATCVWEGNAEVGFSLFQDDQRHAFALNTHATFTNDTTLVARTIVLLDLTPYPHVDSVYQAEQFEVRIFVDQ